MTADNLYAIPLLLEQEGLAREVCNHLRLESFVPDNSKWEEMITNIRKIGNEKRNYISTIIIFSFMFK